MYNTIINRAADNLRALCVAMVENAGSGHPGGSMGACDFINILYSEFLNFDPDNMHWPFRDRFFLDPGHMSPMLYSILSMFGVYSTEDLKGFRQWQSKTPGHPELNVSLGIENTSGPLGQGHAMAVGAAIAEKFLVNRFGDWMSHKIFTMISDGGIQEEIAMGAARIAGHLGLDNLIMFYDSNDIQLSTKVSQVTSEDTSKKYEALGWEVMTIDGNDHREIRNALQVAVRETEKPVLIIGKTVMGKGCVTEDGESFEYQVSTHGQPISKAGASVEKTLRNLGADPADPFAVFPDVLEYYDSIIKEKREKVREKEKYYESWREQNPDLDRKLHTVLQANPPGIDFESIQYKANAPTRSASGSVLSALSGNVENMIVISADLSNSDKTEGFLQNTRPIERDDFSGAFLHVGVSELTMAALANGLALHNIIPVCGTFFVFSDFMKPAIRLAALMELPVIYVWTHDSFRVGEDGPTHQPVEQEAQIRLLEKTKNHSGNNSILALRPADGAETVIAWKLALENRLSPTGLILSRQAVRDIPDDKTTALERASRASSGGYIVAENAPDPDIILVAGGSEVSTLLEAYDILRGKSDLKMRVVSLISEGLFLRQPEEYRNSIIPDGKPLLGLTAGLPACLSGIAGPRGRVLGLDHFGYSAPYQVLDDKFGYSGTKIAGKIMQYLNDLQEPPEGQ